MNTIPCHALIGDFIPTQLSLIGFVRMYLELHQKSLLSTEVVEKAISVATVLSSSVLLLGL
jgi:hypothetical protein